MNFISCVKWVKQGVSKSIPDVISLDEEEIQQLIQNTNDENDSTRNEESRSLDASSGDEYDFANYDNEDGNLRANVKDIVTFDETSKKKKSKKKKHLEKDSDSEDEIIKDDDNLILVGHVDDDFNGMNVYVYNENDGDMYIHHDFILKSAPLSVEWVSALESSGDNFCAIGEMDPVIGIWDLDIVNCVEPVLKLGRAKKKNANKNYGHSDAVLSLSWNAELPHILCSGSVDQRALLWDLHNGEVATELTEFTDKVQTVLWNSHNPYSLLSGCADGYFRNFDCRVYNEFQKWNLRSEIECVLCHSENERGCFVGTNDGKIHYLDYRRKKPVYSLQAHDQEVTGLGLHQNKKILISVSADENMRFWDVDNEFQLLSSKNLKLGSLCCIDMNPNHPYLACVGGSHQNRGKKILEVINVNDVLRPEEKSCESINSVDTHVESFKVPLLENHAPEIERAKRSHSMKRKKKKEPCKKKKPVH